MSIDKLSNFTDYEMSVCVAWFGDLEPHKGVLRFSMKDVRPTAASQAVLNKLVSEGLVKRIYEVGGGVKYIPLFDSSSLVEWFEYNYDRNEFTESLLERAEQVVEPVMTISPDGDARVVVMYSCMDEIMKLSREQHEQFLSFLDNWGYFKARKKDDNLYRDKLRSMIAKALKKTRELLIV